MRKKKTWERKVEHFENQILSAFLSIFYVEFQVPDADGSTTNGYSSKNQEPTVAMERDCIIRAGMLNSKCIAFVLWKGIVILTEKLLQQKLVFIDFIIANYRWRGKPLSTSNEVLTSKYLAKELVSTATNQPQAANQHWHYKVADDFKVTKYTWVTMISKKKNEKKKMLQTT